jgi:hypothetical protein
LKNDASKVQALPGASEAEPSEIFKRKNMFIEENESLNNIFEVTLQGQENQLLQLVMKKEQKRWYFWDWRRWIMF